MSQVPAPHTSPAVRSFDRALALSSGPSLIAKDREPWSRRRSPP
jgi:hypothetical protein